MSLETIGLNDGAFDNDNNQDDSSNLEETGNQNSRKSIPGNSFSFPKSFKHECARSCKPNYLKASFVYSQNDDAVFCLQCSMFLNSDVRSK